MNKPTTIRIPAAQFADEDDCLAACAAKVADERQLKGWNLAPRWADEQRNEILVDVPAGMYFQIRVRRA